MNNGLICPLCRTWYSNDPEALSELGLLGIYQTGDVCGNEAMSGPHPELCSPNHPCPGILRLVTNEEVTRKKRK